MVNPLRRSCVSDARNLGETAFVRLRGQPSAEIVRVECAKPRRNCVTRCAWSTLCGDRTCRMCEMYAVPLGHWNALTGEGLQCDPGFRGNFRHPFWGPRFRPHFTARGSHTINLGSSFRSSVTVRGSHTTNIGSSSGPQLQCAGPTP